MYIILHWYLWTFHSNQWGFAEAWKNIFYSIYETLLSVWSIGTRVQPPLPVQLGIMNIPNLEVPAQWNTHVTGISSTHWETSINPASSEPTALLASTEDTNGYTCPHAEVLLYWVFVAEYSDCSPYRCFASFTILKFQRNYSSSQPGMGITQTPPSPFLPVSVHHHHVSFWSLLKTLYCGAPPCFLIAGSSAAIWNGSDLTSPENSLVSPQTAESGQVPIFVPWDSDCGPLRRRTPSQHTVWINAQQCVCNESQGNGGRTTVNKSYGHMFLL